MTVADLDEEAAIAAQRGRWEEAVQRGRWEEVQRLHDAEGVGYLEAFIHVSPDLRASTAIGEARRRAAEQLCEAARFRIDAPLKAIEVLQHALREAMTSLQLEHPAIILLNLGLAQMLSDAGQHEQALRKWRWLLPRSARLPAHWSPCGFEVRMQMATCLLGLQRHEEAGKAALEAIQQRVQTDGQLDKQAVSQLDTFIQRVHRNKAFPPAILIQLLQLHMQHLDRNDVASVSTRCRNMAALQGCYRTQGDHVQAAPASKEWARLMKQLHGRYSLEHLFAYWNHADNLIQVGEYAKAVSILLRVLRYHRELQGEKQRTTLHAATNIGEALVRAKNYDVGLRVCAKAWHLAKGVLKGDDVWHSLLHDCYVRALRSVGRPEEARVVDREAKRRGLDCD